jgi:probable F420-dependent oxidoreductase
VTRPFRFGIQADPHRPRRQWIDFCRRAENLGYGVVTLPDHIGPSGGIFAAVAVAADHTERLRLGTLVLNNDLRNPAVLGMEAATADLLTDGRLELGIGAGWMGADYRAAGIAQDGAGTRIQRLAEAVEILRTGWQGEPFSFSGRHYQLEAAAGWPRPAQSPLPLLIGGGARRVLSLAGAAADIVSVNRNLREPTPAGAARQGMLGDDLHRKLGWVRAAAGDRDPELHTFVLTAAVTDDRAAAAARIAAQYGISPADVLASPHFLVGTPAQMVDDLRRRRDEFGFSYLTVREASHTELAPVVAALAAA